MTQEVRWLDKARKEFLKLDKPVQRRIAKFLRERVVPASDPRFSGKALKGTEGEIWRYRVGDYRLLCRIEDDKLVILIVAVGHRKSIYQT